jgi:acetyl-CoA carboxylase carboxyltransferase component
MSISDSKNRFESEVNALSDSNARKRLTMLFDNGTFHEIDRFVKNNGTECEVVAAYGEVNGMLVYAYAQSIEVCGGAMGKVQAAKISHVYDLATKTGAPVVSVFDSNGAHIDEGVQALEAYGALIKAAGNISGVVPQISVVAGPCIGSAAVLASLSDFVIMTDKAEFYITSPDFAESSDNNLGTAKLAMKNGTAALVAEDDKNAMEMVSDILAYLPSNNLSEALMTEYVTATGGDAVLDVVDAGSFTELYEDFGKCIKTGFARIGGASVGIVSTDASVNNGYFCANGAKKAAKFVRMCDAFSIPVITFVDSLGVLAKESEELCGGVKSISLLTSAYSEATTPKITVVNGNAVAGAYIAFVSSAAAPDMVFALENSVIGALEPMTAVQLLYKDRILAGENREDLEKEYALDKCSPFGAAAIGLVNDVITREETAAKIVSALDVLSSKRVSTLSKKHTNIPL